MALAGRTAPPAYLSVWQRHARHCPLCAQDLVRAMVEGRTRLRCTSCTFVVFENPACAAAGVVIDTRRRVLLVRRRIEPFKGQWALPAGYQEVDEEPSQTAVREVREEAGVEVEIVQLLDLLFIPEDQRKPANLAVFLCRHLSGDPSPGDDAAEAAWFDLHGLPEDLGFSNGPRILHRLRDGDRLEGW